LGASGFDWSFPGGLSDQYTQGLSFTFRRKGTTSEEATSPVALPVGVEVHGSYCAVQDKCCVRHRNAFQLNDEQRGLNDERSQVWFYRGTGKPTAGSGVAGRSAAGSLRRAVSGRMFRQLRRVSQGNHRYRKPAVRHGLHRLCGLRRQAFRPCQGWQSARNRRDGHALCSIHQRLCGR
jgi:hypothetical protein